VTQALVAVATGQASRSLSIVAVRRVDDPARLAGLLGARRRAGPTVAVLIGEHVGARTSQRILNALRFDAWVTAKRPGWIAAPAVGDLGRA
jgi:hypothetical protein